MAAKSSKSPRKPSPKKSLKKRPLPKVRLIAFSSNKRIQLKDLNALKENDYVMVDPKDLDHSILPENRPLIAKITEVNREDEYIAAEWMMMVSFPQNFVTLFLILTTSIENVINWKDVV